MTDELRALVRERAGGQCEYCRSPEVYDLPGSGIDHIRARFHHGPTEPENLCLACFWCNTYKGTNAAGFDPVTSSLMELFHPRHHQWEEHFHFDSVTGEIIGRSPIGRTTADVLRMNDPLRVELRRSLFAEGVWR